MVVLAWPVEFAWICDSTNTRIEGKTTDLHAALLQRP